MNSTSWHCAQVIRCPGLTWATRVGHYKWLTFLLCCLVVGVIKSYYAFLCLPTYALQCQFLLHYLLALSRWVNEGVWQRSHMTMVAWALLQDSFHTTLSLHHPPHTIATAVLYLSLHCCKLEVPGGRFAQRQWWEVFSPGTSEQTLQDIACKIMSVSDKSQDSGSN